MNDDGEDMFFVVVYYRGAYIVSKYVERRLFCTTVVGVVRMMRRKLTVLGVVQ